MRARIIDNPYSYRGPYPAERVLPIFAAAGWQVDVVHRLPGAGARTMVLEALDDGCDVVIGAGGDGTLRDLATYLAGRDAALGILPGGTANVLAHELGIPTRPEAAARALVEGTPRRIDVARIDLPDGRWTRFLLTAGLGLDGAIMARTDPRLKRRVGAGAVAFSAIGTIPTFRPHAVEVVVDERPVWSGRALQVLVSNTRLYANLIRPTPGALIDDGLLDALAIPYAGWTAIGRLTGSLVATREPSGAVTVPARGAEVHVHAPASIPIQLDGSPLGWKPAPSATSDGTRDATSRETVVFRFRAEPAALRAWLPRDVPDGLFGPRAAATVGTPREDVRAG